MSRLSPGLANLRRSLRLQLTAWYVAFFSLLFILFGIFLYGVLASALQARLDETLSAQANTTAALMADELVEEKGDAYRAASEAASELRGSVAAILMNNHVLASSASFFSGGFEAVAAHRCNDTVNSGSFRRRKSARHWRPIATCASPTTRRASCSFSTGAISGSHRRISR